MKHIHPSGTGMGRRAFGRRAAVVLALAAGPGAGLPAAASDPPAVRREFRAAWIATVANIDWPSRPGLPADRQRAELAALLDRAAWRRHNVDRLVERLWTDVKAAKPHVLVGISPFGIWRPGHPPGIKGLDQVAALNADPRKWLHEGWTTTSTV